LIRSILFPGFFSKLWSGCLSCFDQAAQCRWPSFRGAGKLTFASSMKTAAGPLKARRATSETPTLRMSSRNFTFLRRAPFSPLRSISRCGAHRSPSARSRKSSRSLFVVSSRRGTPRGGRKDEGLAENRRVRRRRLYV